MLCFVDSTRDNFISSVLAADSFRASLQHCSRENPVHPMQIQKCSQLLLANRCFEPSQPLGTISGLKEIFIKRYIVERTNQ